MTHWLSQVITNDELLRKVQREWLSRQWRDLNRWLGWRVTLAEYWLFRTLSAMLGWLRVVVSRLDASAEARARRAWHSLRPFDFWGERSNFEAQRGYDGLRTKFDAMSAIERNAMVPGKLAILGSGLQSDVACAVPSKTAGEVVDNAS